MKNADMPMSVSLSSQGAHFYGLTKREYFAAMAMQGILSNSSGDYDFGGAATDAVRYADALLTELEKTQ